jgi:hypothetical protein
MILIKNILYLCSEFWRRVVMDENVISSPSLSANNIDNQRAGHIQT